MDRLWTWIAFRLRVGRELRMRLAAGSGSVVVATLVVSIAVHAGAEPACADKSVERGTATYFGLGATLGNCSYPTAPADDLYAALSPAEYAGANSCGTYLDVSGPHGTVRVLVVDQCPPCATGHIDLSREAFARIADPVRGVVTVTYWPVANPPLPGPLTFRVKDGASRDWFAVLVANHGNALVSVLAQPPGEDWRVLTRADYNYWVAAGGLGPGPVRLRVTDAAGHSATIADIRIAPDRDQTSTTWLYGPGAAHATGESRPSRSPDGGVSSGEPASESFPEPAGDPPRAFATGGPEPWAPMPIPTGGACGRTNLSHGP